MVHIFFLIELVEILILFIIVYYNETKQQKSSACENRSFLWFIVWKELGRSVTLSSPTPFRLIFS